jgi:5-methylcytosine-specific restriction enzyme subunit McrC
LSWVERELGSIGLIRLDRSVFRRVRLHRNNAHYGFLLQVCELAYDTALPEEGGGGYHFAAVLRDERKMALTFQSFVRNFYRLEQQRFRVTGLQLSWDAVPSCAEDADLLPIMVTDIFLESSDRSVIMDTKYYRSALSENYSKPSLHGANLYQMFAYVKNAEAKGMAFQRTEGLLLYPTVGDPVRASYLMQGHQVSVASLNLDQPWRAVALDLLSLIGEPEAIAATGQLHL